MEWFGSGYSGPLIAIRAIHFAAISIATGSLIFGVVVARAALRSEQAVTREFRAQTSRVAWICLAVTVVSGAIWFVCQAASISGFSCSEAMTSGVLLTVLNQTQFGLVSGVRLVLALILAACLAFDRHPLAEWLAPVAALGLTAAVAWTGHAASTIGEAESLHLAADALHLVAAASWIGGLVSFVLALVVVRRHRSVAWASLAREVTVRFSVLGMVSVGALLATGIVNAWVLVCSYRALIVTEYGRLLMLKVAAFMLMLTFAAVNRFWLTPKLDFSSGNELRFEALRQLTRNSAIEIALGLTIFAIVGILGTLHPAIHPL
jgi:putative copper resistance protein D